MFPAYRIEDRQKQNVVRVGKWSYVWAGLFGVFYLVFKAGVNKVMRGVLLTLACTAALIVLPFGTARYVPGALQIVVLVLGLPAVFILQSFQTVALVRQGYQARGWKVRQED